MDGVVVLDVERVARVLCVLEAVDDVDLVCGTDRDTVDDELGDRESLGLDVLVLLVVLVRVDVEEDVPVLLAVVVRDTELDPVPVLLEVAVRVEVREMYEL